MSIIVRNTNLPSLFNDFFDNDFFGPHDVLMDKLFNKAFPNTSKELGGPLFESKDIQELIFVKPTLNLYWKLKYLD